MSLYWFEAWIHRAANAALGIRYPTCGPLTGSAAIPRRAPSGAPRSYVSAEANATDRAAFGPLRAMFFSCCPLVKIWTRTTPNLQLGSGPCSVSKAPLTLEKTSRARSSVTRSWVAMTLVRRSAPPGGTAGWIATFTKTPAS